MKVIDFSEQPSHQSVQIDCLHPESRLCLATVAGLRTDALNQLTEICSPLNSKPSISDQVWTFRELSSDFAGVIVGLTTRSAMNEICQISRCAWPTKAAALGLQLFMAAATKDLTADGHLGDWQDLARGGGVYAGSLVLLRSLSLSPTRLHWDVGLARSIHHKFPKAYPMPSNRNEVIAKLGSEVPISKQIAELLNPRNLNPLNRNLWNPELAADALAHGEISLARYQAQTRMGQLYLTSSTSLGFAAGREYLYLATQKNGGK